MKSSFNAFGRGEYACGSLGTPVWLGTVKPVPAGGVLAAAYLLKGALYQAGTPVNLASKVITPLVVMKVTAVTTGVVTVDPGNYGIVPTVSDFIQKMGATFAKNGPATAITAVAVNSSDPTKLDITTSLSLSAGDTVAIVPSSEGAAIPNGYLYNDIWLGDIDLTSEGAAATGAVVSHHAEGLLVDRTPAAGVKAQMLAVVPGVYQVED